MVRGVAILAIVVVAAAQTGTPPPAFEVASVKLYAPQLRPGQYFFAFSDGPPSQFQISGTRVSTRGNLMSLVAGMYGLERFQVRQGPDWTDKWATSEIYDIEARTPSDAIPRLAQVRQMMQTLLADRFQIKSHKETKILPVYALTVAKGGPKLKETDPDTAAAIQAMMAAAGRGEATPPPPPAPGKGPPPGAIIVQVTQNGMTLKGAMDMTRLVMALSNSVDRPVIDSTDLKGIYDIELTFMPDESSNFNRGGIRSMPSGGGGPPGGAGDARIGPPPINEPVGNIFQALQSLGLKLESRKDRIETLVIEHANKAPTENE